MDWFRLKPVGDGLDGKIPPKYELSGRFAPLRIRLMGAACASRRRTHSLSLASA